MFPSRHVLRAGWLASDIAAVPARQRYSQSAGRFFSLLVVFATAAYFAPDSYAQDEPLQTQTDSLNPQELQSSANQLANLKAVEEQIRKRLEETDNDPFLLHKLGTVLYRQGEILEARKIWDQAANRNDNIADSDISIALELLNKGDVKATIQALNSAQKKNDKNPHLYLARGDLFFRKQDFTNAEKEFLKALELNPDLLVTHIWLGRFYQAQQDLQKATEHFTRGTEVAPDRAEAWVLLAAVQFQQNQIKAALTSLQQAEQHDYEQQLAEVRMANFYMALNDFIGARRFLLDAVERKPDNLVARLTLADVLLRLEKPDEARIHLEHSLQDEVNLKAIVTLAELERRAENYERAVELYRRGLETQPDHVVLNNNLAMTLLSFKPHDEEALKLAETAMKGGGQNPGIQGTYACALMDAGKIDEAAEAIPALVRQLPGDPWIRFAYGKLLAGQDRPEDARVQLEGCLILDEKFPRRQDVEELLSTLK